MKPEKLEKGKLYQVKHWEKGWIIAEFQSFVASHMARGLNHKGERTWREADKWYWKEVVGTQFVTDRARVRECSAEALETIARLRSEIAETDARRALLVRELRQFCS